MTIQLQIHWQLNTAIKQTPVSNLDHNKDCIL